VTELAIRARGLGKRYRIGAGSGYRTLRDAVMEAVTAPFRAVRQVAGGEGATTPRPSETIWALRDVSFDVAPGEAVGIIGRNGAGKSTLLKILSRITEPTEGTAQIRGRVGSLLEVGTGFHLELTGRENIFLNGAILGMTKAEIDRKFDQIVGFAEVDRFIDTPVKHYSSGMYLRLAFAVAAHLDPEILIVDEVLAVGDVQFQRKCLGKMQEVSRAQGRTVLFVSHNMDAIRRLCSRCLLLEGGRLVAQGDTPGVVGRYLEAAPERARPGRWLDLGRVGRTGSGQARFTAARFGSGNRAVGDHPYVDGPLEVWLEIASDAPRAVGSLAVTVYDRSGAKLVNADSISQGRRVLLGMGTNRVRLRIESLHLTPGVYVVGLWLADPIDVHARGAELDHIQWAFEIEVVDPEPGGLGMRPRADGVVACRFEVFEEEAGAEPGSGASA
jgi:lipopolysaccharide transport system ATP-binding protein